MIFQPWTPIHEPGDKGIRLQDWKSPWQSLYSSTLRVCITFFVKRFPGIRVSIERGAPPSEHRPVSNHPKRLLPRSCCRRGGLPQLPCPSRVGLRFSGFAFIQQTRRRLKPNRVYHCFVYRLAVRFRLLPTPPLGDAVTFRYGGSAPSGRDFHPAAGVRPWAHWIGHSMRDGKAIASKASPNLLAALRAMGTHRAWNARSTITHLESHLIEQSTYRTNLA